MQKYEIKDLYQEIDYQYLEHLQVKCSNTMRIKQELQYKVYYYQSYPKYRDYYQKELNNLDMGYCNRYSQFNQHVR